MTPIIITFIAGFVTFLSLNHLALTVVFRKIYASSLRNHTIVENSTIRPYVPAVLLFMAAAILSIFIFVLSITPPPLYAHFYTD